MKKKLQPIKGGVHGCLNCGYTPSVLSMQTRLFDRFGGYSITKNGEHYFTEESGKTLNKCKLLADIEKEARLDPDNDWRCFLELPLRSAIWQRQDGKWMLVKKGGGFA